LRLAITATRTSFFRLMMWWRFLVEINHEQWVLANLFYEFVTAAGKFDTPVTSFITFLVFCLRVWGSSQVTKTWNIILPMPYEWNIPSSIINCSSDVKLLSSSIRISIIHLWVFLFFFFVLVFISMLSALYIWIEIH
jgi:hypothetical protein